jgi:hypothetical protein
MELLLMRLPSSPYFPFSNTIWRPLDDVYFKPAVTLSGLGHLDALVGQQRLNILWRELR